MDFDLSDEHRALRETVREFAEGVIAPVAEELDRESRFPVDIVRRLGEMGLMGVPFDAELGGGGADTLAVRDHDRGADADRLVGRRHRRGAHVARHLADRAVRQRRAEGAVPARPLLGPEARRPSG